jgi:hypothetical protein
MAMMRDKGAVALALGCSMLMWACDKVYFARVDVGPQATASINATPLSVAERELAANAFSAAASDLGLHCVPASGPMIARSFDPSEYRLSLCRAEGEYAMVQLAVSDKHLAVEIQQVSSLHEPPFFRKCQTRISKRLTDALPRGRVSVRYPYRWGEGSAHAR